MFSVVCGCQGDVMVVAILLQWRQMWVMWGYRRSTSQLVNTSVSLRHAYCLLSTYYCQAAVHQTLPPSSQKTETRIPKPLRYYNYGYFNKTVKMRRFVRVSGGLPCLVFLIPFVFLVVQNDNVVDEESALPFPLQIPAIPLCNNNNNKKACKALWSLHDGVFLYPILNLPSMSCTLPLIGPVFRFSILANYDLKFPLLKISLHTRGTSRLHKTYWRSGLIEFVKFAAVNFSRVVRSSSNLWRHRPNLPLGFTPLSSPDLCLSAFVLCFSNFIIADGN